ncbi:MAG TPA: hypothetical protein VHW02_10550 [Rhizomicrobium sp.]|jgi:hypothetical protein|nr:hypothetical protein [Rhizomicrobium sp.]
MKKHFLTLIIPLLLVCGAAQAKDGFETVRCGGDIPRALIGVRTNNEPVVATEARHKALALKDLGGDEISDNLSSVEWSICGGEYMTLVDTHGMVTDAIAILPQPSKTTPEFAAGICKLNGKDTTGGWIVAVLDNSAGGNAPLLPAKSAWRINEKTNKFEPVPVAGLLCPRDGALP